MSDTNKIRLVHITLYNFFARIVFFAFVLLAGVYAARFFLKEEFGQAQYISWMVSFSWLIFNFGAPATINRYIAQGRSSGQDTRLISRFGTVMLLFTLVSSLLFWWLYGAFTNGTCNMAATIYLFTFIIANYLQVVMQARFLFRPLLFTSIAAVGAGSVSLFILLPLMRIEGYIWTMAIVHAVLIAGYGISLMLNKKEHGSSPGGNTELKGLWRTTIYFGVSSILASLLWQRTELYFIKQYLDFSRVALYGVALTTISLATEILRILPGSLLSYFSAIKDDHALVQQRLYVFMRYFSWLAVFICFFTATSADPVIRFLFTEKYAESAMYVRILFVGFLPGVCSYVIMNLHIGLGRSKFLMIQDAVAAVLFIAACFVFIPAGGLEGAAWSKAVAMLIAVVMGMGYTIYRLKLDLPLRYMVSSLILATALLVPARDLLAGNIFFLGLKAIITFCLYYFISLRIGIIEKETVYKIASQIFGSRKIK